MDMLLSAFFPYGINIWCISYEIFHKPKTNEKVTTALVKEVKV